MFLMVLNYACDQLHRVAASRIMSLMIDNAKLRRNNEVGKYFEQMIQKTFNSLCAKWLMHNKLHLSNPRLSPSYRHIDGGSELFTIDFVDFLHARQS